jgi:hypothetical protein
MEITQYMFHGRAETKKNKKVFRPLLGAFPFKPPPLVGGVDYIP